MKTTRMTLAAAALATSFALAGCAHAGHHAGGHEHHADPPARHDEARPMGPARTVELPKVAGGAQPKESTMVLKEPGLTVAAIVLRGGTVLPEHHSMALVTIQAVEGRGVVVMKGGERLPLGPGQLVFVPPGAPHAVEPDAGSDLLLLVTHAGNPGHHP